MSFANFFGKWIAGDGPACATVLSSRVRLARNLRHIPFPSRYQADDAEEILTLVAQAVQENLADFQMLRFAELPLVERRLLSENHLISIPHAENDLGAIVLNRDASVSVMVNEEDHLRIQSILSGLQLEQSWQEAARIDDLLAEKLDFAYDSRLGYLTACPTNVGTGMRASVMLHLPGLAYTKQLEMVLRSATRLGLAVRGMYGEGSEVAGSMVQISNQSTLGSRETEIIDRVSKVTLQIVEQERQSREFLVQKERVFIQDLVGRAYGILSNAYQITIAEAVRLLSDLKVGIELGFQVQIKKKEWHELLMSIYPAHLEGWVGKKFSATEIDSYRATFLRKKLNSEEEL